MDETALVDNDVVLKLCCYGCHHGLARALGGARPTMLRVGRHVLLHRAARSRGIQERERVAEALAEAFAIIGLAEPDEDETELAARMEEDAARLALPLDVGESQLLAMLLTRAAPLLVTGDKRAVVAVHDLDIEGVDGRIACLEQVMTALLDDLGLAALRAAVCAEPKADRAVAACFGCSGGPALEASVREGLSSYVEHLRAATGSTLVAGDRPTERPA